MIPERRNESLDLRQKPWLSRGQEHRPALEGLTGAIVSVAVVGSSGG